MRSRFIGNRSRNPSEGEREEEEEEIAFQSASFPSRSLSVLATSMALTNKGGRETAGLSIIETITVTDSV